MTPKKILFLCDAIPFSENLNGASSFKYAHLKLLLKTFPQSFVHILVLDYYQEHKFQTTQLETDIPSDSYKIEILSLLNYKSSNLKRQINLLRPNLNAIRYFHTFINHETVALVSKSIKLSNADFIWTEHSIPNYFALSANTSVPIVYVHHDFLWKLQQIKNNTVTRKKKVVNQLLRLSEHSQIRRNKYIVSGSQSEIGEIESISPQVITAILPTTYKSVEVKDGSTDNIRIVHVGNMFATSNKVGLSRFLTVCWPDLCQLPKPPELLVIGKIDTGHSQEVMKLLSQPNIKVLGHVENLSDVLQPYDLHIIPYEHDTGTRTRIPLALNYKQILLSTQNASKGVKGLKNNENCLLVDSLAEMTQRIREVLARPGNYVSIAQKGKELFESNYTEKSQQKELLHFLEKIKA